MKLELHAVDVGGVKMAEQADRVDVASAQRADRDIAEQQSLGPLVLCKVISVSSRVAGGVATPIALCVMAGRCHGAAAA